ncbi:2-hydroxychromene-2-carboxylate isomerase [Undibacterium arcticum]
MDQKKRGELEFWFDFGSNYSYLSVMRIRELARSAEVDVRWRPFLLGPIFKSFGWETSPFVLQKEKGAYMWQDMLRQCRKIRHCLAASVAVPAPFAAAVAGRAVWRGAAVDRAVLRARDAAEFFSADQDINAESSVAYILDRLDLDAAAIIAAAQSEDNKLRLRQRTEQAKALGIFGAPTFFCGW